MKEEEAISARYRAYCDACQSNKLHLLTNFWVLPSTFTVDFGQGEVLSRVIQTSQELQEVYSKEFGPSTGVDETIIDSEVIHFFGDNLATIMTSLRHNVKGKLHDKQHALYGCMKKGDTWMFISHISRVEQMAS